MNHAMTNAELGWLLIGACVGVAFCTLAMRMWIAFIITLLVGVTVYVALIA